MSSQDDAKHEPKNNVSNKKSRFTNSEDDKLKIFFQKYGANWVKISEEIGSKTPRQCRNRWTLYLNPAVSAEPFSREETQALMFWVEKCGTDWSIIVNMFPGRSASALKNHFTTYCSRNKIDKKAYIETARRLREERKKTKQNDPNKKKKE